MEGPWTNGPGYLAAEARLAGPLLPGDVPRLIELLRYEDRGKRRSAAEDLAELALNYARETATAIPALIAALGDIAPEVQSWAANALGNLGPAARLAIPALQLAAVDPRYTDYVRANAVIALRKIIPDV